MADSVLGISLTWGKAVEQVAAREGLILDAPELREWADLRGLYAACATSVALLRCLPWQGEPSADLLADLRAVVELGRPLLAPLLIELAGLDRGLTTLYGWPAGSAAEIVLQAAERAVATNGQEGGVPGLGRDPERHLLALVRRELRQLADRTCVRELSRTSVACVGDGVQSPPIQCEAPPWTAEDLKVCEVQPQVQQFLGLLWERKEVPREEVQRIFWQGAPPPNGLKTLCKKANRFLENYALCVSYRGPTIRLTSL